MGFFAVEPVIASDEGFTPQNDIFGRKTFGEKLTRIIGAVESPSVLLLDAPWGTGKTTFVKMWRGELAKLGIPSIYFDAFANDYQEDTFIAIASQIIAEAESLKSLHKDILIDFKTKAMKAAKLLGIAAVKIGVRVGTAGLNQIESSPGFAGVAVVV